MTQNKISTESKALQINLDPRKYGTIAEIGAGQEVARHFFRAGAAAGTIAKTVSAYDMQFSNAIYGADPHGRYVSRSRLLSMLEHEFGQVLDRVKDCRSKSSTFFAYGATVAAKSFKRNNECHAWCGVRLQLYPNAAPSDIILHVRMLDKEVKAQQEALGVLGVNLIYGAYYLHDDPRKLIDSLTDGLDNDRIEVDLIEFFGPYFDDLDNRVLNLHLIRSWKTRAIMFDAEGVVQVPAEFLYKKNVLVTRGSFKPFTLLNMDMIHQGKNNFFQESDGVNEDNTVLLAEITLNELVGNNKDMDDRDFVERVDQLNALGLNVMISDYVRHFRLRAYFRQYTQRQIGMIIGMSNLRQIFNEDFYKGVEGGILEGFGKLFPDNTVVYAYPEKRGVNEETDIDNIVLPERLRYLFLHLTTNHFIRAIHDSDPNLFDIQASDVLADLQSGCSDWEDKVPQQIVDMIKERRLFGYNSM